jgi:hypothetical protein
MAYRITHQLGWLMAMLLTPFAVLADETPPSDPFDYSYCGGKPMYPVIGFNFSTYCGPRNQIALGRRGRLMWLFPTPEGHVHARGERQLSAAELAELNLLAQAAQLAGPQPPVNGRVLYDMGINFSGQTNKRAHGALFGNTEPDSAQALFAAMQRLVTDKPLLPECKEAVADFSPTLLPKNRQPKAKP